MAVVRADGPALAVLRPEAALLLPPGAEAGIPARVRQVRFTGSGVRYRLAWGPGQIEVHAPAGVSGAMPPDTPVRLWWEPAAIWYIDPVRGE